ncbi:hypothetical protein ACWEQL_00885 [Kitasatospora sp. NPDC004240]
MVGWMVALVLVAAIGVAWWRRRYPGAWRFAFAGAHSKDRQELDDARGAHRTGHGRARTELARAETRVKQADQAHHAAVVAAERAVARLRRPGRGGLVAELGEVALYEHVLVFKDTQMPLAGLAARFELARNSSKMYIYLTRSDGRVELPDYTGEDFEEEDVRRFSVRIQNAVADENEFRHNREDAIRQAETAADKARADTAAQDKARAHLEAVAARHTDSAELADLDADLEAARDRWEALTGCRPR